MLNFIAEHQIYAAFQYHRDVKRRSPPKVILHIRRVDRSTTRQKAIHVLKQATKGLTPMPRYEIYCRLFLF